MVTDLDQAALDCLQDVTTYLYAVSMPRAQRHAKAQNAIRAALAAARAEGERIGAATRDAARVARRDSR
jgi:hypothetical protein